MDIFGELKNTLREEIKHDFILGSIFIGFIMIFLLFIGAWKQFLLFLILMLVAYFFTKRNEKKIIMKFNNNEYKCKECKIKRKSYSASRYGTSFCIEMENGEIYWDITYVSYKKYNVGDEVLAIHFSFGKNWLNEEKGVTYLLPITGESSDER